MTKTDAEQHAAVWELAAKLMISDWEEHKSEGAASVAARLACSDLARSVSKGYETMAKAIHADS